MAAEKGTMREPVGPAPVVVEDELVPEAEYNVTLAYRGKPVAVLTGVITVIRPGPQDLALSDQEWEDLELFGMEQTADGE